VKTIVVGFDARQEAMDALALGRELAAADEAELHVAVVQPRGGAPFERAVAGARISEELDDQLFETAARALEGLDFTRASLDGSLGGRSAARALYEYAEERGADLIVVGSSHRGKLGRILPGSVGESLLRGAPCAIAVAPRGFAGREHEGFALVGSAYDGSEEAELALREAERVSRALGAELRVITVVPTQAQFTMKAALAGELLEDIRDEFRGVLERGLAELDEGTKAEADLREGDPAEVLAKETEGLDLLVVGSRGYGPIRGALLGGVSAAVTRTAACPILVVPRGGPVARGAAVPRAEIADAGAA
jgi:nucleotide-binding universal stress UspA family protein